MNKLTKTVIKEKPNYADYCIILRSCELYSYSSRKTKIIAFDKGERFLVVSVPRDDPRVYILMPHDFSVWMLSWTGWLAGCHARSDLIVYGLPACLLG